MKLYRDIIWVDLETTGPDILKDRIIEIGAKKIKTDGTIETYYSLFNPVIPIEAGATEKHGYTNQELSNQPLFESKANEIFSFFQNADLGGYNIKKFDVPFLTEEFLRSKLIWNLSNVKFFDPFRIWTKFEGRTLVDAYKKFCNKELVDAHSAIADIDATIEIAKKQETLFNIENIDQANDFSLYDKEKVSLDLAGKIILVENEEVLSFGKYKDKKFKDVLNTDESYVDWLSRSDAFSQQTKIAFKLLKNKYSNAGV